MSECFDSRETLHSHLLCNFCSEIFFLLFDSFAYFESDNLLQCQVLVNRLQILANCLLTIFSSYVSLVNKADFLELLGDTSVNETLEDLVLGDLSLISYSETCKLGLGIF